jgi:hypothetical protein
MDLSVIAWLAYITLLILSMTAYTELSDRPRSMKALYLLCLFGFYPAVAFTEYQNALVRKQLVNHHAPQFSAMVDAVLAKDYAFTDQQKLLTHIDAARFQCCPNSFSNTVIHECHHLNQRQHTIGVKDDPMSYLLTINQNGDVSEDNFVLPPLSPSQPWAAQILAPRTAGPVTVPLYPVSLPTRIIHVGPFGNVTKLRRRRVDAPTIG